ncbi:hypothetical protein [Amycolatopsis sp. NPDC059657]|uniref:hypothetical protein n=1 Tax=Amycolatopsis sp. NPDC059657 TaxID=3346899 RepID=UPI00366C4E5D
MITVEPIPGLTLDETMYELAAAGVAEHTPHVGQLTWERFTDPAHWLHIPDLDGEISKSELTLLNGVEATVKLNIWFRPDVRGGEDQQIPHNHRWSQFRGHLLRGAYAEARYERTNVDPETGRAEVLITPRVVHESPGVNAVDHETYHEVLDVLVPATMSLMDCDRGELGNWGHLDLATGKQFRDQPVPTFEAMFAALNPHRAPR